MTLPTATTLNAIAGSLAARVAPVVADDFAGETLRLAGILLAISANAADDAVALRVEENAAMRNLFAESAQGVSGDLAAQLGDAAASQNPGLRLSDLDPENDRLRRLLVALHAQSEDKGDNDTSQRIWRLLDTFETHRAPRA